MTTPLRDKGRQKPPVATPLRSRSAIGSFTPAATRTQDQTPMRVLKQDQTPMKHLNAVSLTILKYPLTLSNQDRSRFHQEVSNEKKQKC
jgi:hypothetical protein